MESSRKLTKGQVDDVETIVFDAGISRTLALTDLGKTIVFTGSNPVSLTLPTNAAVPLVIGFKVKVTQQGAGIVTSSTAGISAISDSGYISALGETRTFVKTDTNTWSIEGNQGSNNRTFTGTTVLPATTSIGSITSVILGYLSGLTSNVQNQLNAKLTAATGTVNYLQKVISANVLGNSLIQEVNGFLGIGTVNPPTKNLTFGNQGDKEIGIEESANTSIGRSLTQRAGRTINYAPSTFVAMQQTGIGMNSIAGLAIISTSTVYAFENYGTVYRKLQTDVNFANIGSLTTGVLRQACTDSADNLYYANQQAIYKMNAGGTSFVNLGFPVGNYYGVAVTPTGDLYCSAQNGDIYKQTGGVGGLVALGQVSRAWWNMAAHINGNVYAVCNTGVYMQTSGTGDFILVKAGNFTTIACSPNGDVWITSAYTGTFQKQVAGTGLFNPESSANITPSECASIGISPNGSVYVGTKVGAGFTDIWLKNNDALGTVNLDGGTYKMASGTGKGTGKSWWQVWTGQKTVSGTDMQIETLRIQANEVGEVILPSTTIAIIDAETTGKQAVTKEWVQAKAVDVSGKANTTSPTFTGTVVLPSTTSIGSITSTIIGFLSGITSNIQTQLNTKLTIVTGTTNFLPKVTGTNIFGNSRIEDTGTFLGVDTIDSPTKDLTFGNQANRNIGVENSNNTTKGRNFSLSAGKAINFLPNAGFIKIVGEPVRYIQDFWAIGSDMYALFQGQYLKRTNNQGAFEATGIFTVDGSGHTIAPNGDRYICSSYAGVYKQTGGIGTWDSVGLPNSTYRTISAHLNGNIYVTDSASGKIYMQTGGTGAFNDLAQTFRNWYGIRAHQNGNVYAGEISTGNLYMQTNGTGNFNLVQNGISYRHIAISPLNGNVYTWGNNGIYIQTGGSGTFVIIANSNFAFYSLGVATNGSVYGGEYNGGVYVQNNDTVGTPDLDGGTKAEYAGTGKGTGKSWWQVWTGQKLPSGTDMQIETLRIQANEVGEVILPSTTIAIIDAETTGKQVVTKEWAVGKGISDPSQITITTAVSITTDTLGNLGKTQKGKNVIIDNGANAINITVNGGTDFVSSYVKHGSGVITFVQGSGRTLIQVDATAVFNGVVGSTATISSVGLVDYLRISNA
jgi:hypothetical protein